MGEIYFPSYMRNLTEDSELLMMLLRFYKWYAGCVDFERFQPEIMHLLRVISRLASANSYFFDNEIERSRFRQNAA